MESFKHFIIKEEQINKAMKLIKASLTQRVSEREKKKETEKNKVKRRRRGENAKRSVCVYLNKCMRTN